LLEGVEWAWCATHGGEQRDDLVARQIELLDREPKPLALERDVRLQQRAHAAVAQHSERR
jgi:hypothetical protein